MSRYIDVDKLQRHGNRGGVVYWRDIEAQLTADVRENVMGEWIHDEITRNGNTVYTPNAKCSVCDCYVFQESNFCPNCGAEMRPISALSENVEIVSNLKRGES